MDEELRISQLPEAFLKRVSGQLGSELPFFLSAMSQPYIRGLRMNPFRNGGDQPFRDAVARIEWEKNGWEIPVESEAGRTIQHEAGAFYLQEPSAMVPAAVLNAQPGEKILDLCAAPGGKSTHIGSAMKGEGLLICNEPVRKRADILSRNIERMGIPNAIVTCSYPETLARRWQEGFDGVLVDAPCSGEGMFRRHPETREEWSKEKAAGCAVRQQEILDAAARNVRPGGRLVYSTCTWNPAENEENVRKFLEMHPDFRLEPFSLPGINGSDGFFTCWLHRTRGEGQFTALMRRQGAGVANLPDGRKGFQAPREAIKIWEQSGLRTKSPNALFGATLVSMEEIPDLKGIQVLRLGLHLGQVRGKILIPDHAAAVGMCKPEMAETEMTESEALRFLKGETIAGEIYGWTLMTWQGLVLGWGKGSDGQVRNHYPKGLRSEKIIG